MIVTVYTKSDCQPCKFTAKKLDQLGIEYDAVRADNDPAATAKIVEMGFKSAPVVVVDLGDGATWTWAGYRPSEIEKLKEILSGIAA